MAEKIQTITELHNLIRAMLCSSWSPEEARAMATLIIGEYTGYGGARQLAFGDHTVSEAEEALIISAAGRAAGGEPLQYIFGHTLFYGNIISVAPGVLIPRPETEEMTLRVIYENPGFRGTVLDLGTGSGCIAITLARAFPGAAVFAVDNSAEALDIASRNARSNDTTVTFLNADIIESAPENFPECDMIISNPPYVRESERRLMKWNVTGFEPAEALFVPDSDPLVFYRHIAAIAASRLSGGGIIYLEVNEGMAHETAALFPSGQYSEITVSEDLHGKSRFLKAIYNDRAKERG